MENEIKNPIEMCSFCENYRPRQPTKRERFMWWANCIFYSFCLASGVVSFYFISFVIPEVL